MQTRRCICLGVLVVTSAVSAPAAARSALSALPPNARGPVAAALGRSEHRYWIHDSSAANPAQRMRVTFGRHGVSVRSGRVRLGLSLATYGRPGDLVRPCGASARSRVNRVTYRRGAVREWYANGPLGLEQGFDIGRPPGGGPGPMTLTLALSGDLEPRVDHGSVLLSGRGTTLRYGGLVATDARGRSLRAWLSLARRRVVIHVDDRGARYPVHVDPFVQQAVLTAADGAENDQLGRSVAVSGDTVVVGAPFHAVAGNAQQGAVYVFVRPAGGWANASAPTAELTIGDGAASDFLGTSVAVAGDTIVAGAPGRTVGDHQDQGAAYVFIRPASGWSSTSTPTAILTVGNGAAGDELGTSIAGSADTIVAGAMRRLSSTTAAAYVFAKPAAGWTTTSAPNAELLASHSGPDDGFGSALAIVGDTVVAGAPRLTVTYHLQGAAFVFVRPVGGWNGFPTPAAELTIGDGATDDFFGTAVAVSGDTVVAGAPGRASGTKPGVGAAYVFQRPVGGWVDTNTPAATLTLSNGAAGDGLGASVAVFGDTVVGGAPGRGVGKNLDQGAAYVFTKPATGWLSTSTPSRELTAPDGLASDFLGGAAALDGETLALGAPSRAVGINRLQGAAYVFAAPPPAITINSPRDGATYEQGQPVPAAFSCSDPPDGSGLAGCVGTAADGMLVETSRVGAHTFTVTATDTGGQQVTSTVTYTVTPQMCPSGQLGTPPLCQTPLTITGVTQSHRTWREGKRTASISRRRRIPIGTTFAFRLSAGARVTLSFTRHAGRRNRLAGTLTFTARPGRRAVRFDGRLTRTKRLPAGRYAVTVSAQSGRQRATARPMTFTIVP